MCLLPVNVAVGVMLAFLALGCEQNSFLLVAREGLSDPC